MNKISLWIIVIAALILSGVGCSTVPEKQADRIILTSEVDLAITSMKEKDPGIASFFESSYAYAVLPKVFKGAFWVGGAHGKGEVYEQGNMIGHCSMTQATLGFSFGGEFFREIIFFRTKQDLEKFKAGEFAFSAQATAVALTAGAAAKADYKDGMAVFVMAESGLMVDASIGGQKFKYVPKSI